MSTDAPAGQEFPTKNPSKKWRRPSVFIVGTVCLAAVVVWSANLIIHSLIHKSTDDAFVDAHVVTIAPKVAGFVKAVYVKHNQFVHHGDLLIEIDPKEFETRLAQKRAAAEAFQANANSVTAGFDVIKARVVTAGASAKQVHAEVAAAEAAIEKAQSDLARAVKLRGTGAISEQEYQSAKSAADAAAANLRSAREKYSGEESKVHEAEGQLTAARSIMRLYPDRPGAVRARPH